MRFKRSRFVLAALLLTGCAGLIGVPDLTLEEDATDGGTEGASFVDASALDSAKPADAMADSAKTDANQDAATCDTTKTSSDPNHCGRCGHSCYGGTCTSGVCDVTKVGVISTGGSNPGGTRFIATHGDHIYVATYYRAYPGSQGIYRVPKAGGAAVKYASMDGTTEVAIVGNTLYFLVFEPAFDDAGYNGGIWSCDLTGPVPCSPKIVARADTPNGLATDNGVLYFRNYPYYGDDNSVYSHKLDAGDIDASPLVAVMPEPAVSYLYPMWASKNELYAVGSTAVPGNHAALNRWFIDAGGGGQELSRWASNDANPGEVFGNATAVYFTASDFTSATPPGVVRRLPRPGATDADSACELNNGSEKRPAGVFADETNVYWTNQGDATMPWAGGSVAYCKAHGPCCASPNVIWRGDNEPAAITGDDTFLYWVSYRSGEVYKVAKP